MWKFTGCFKVRVDLNINDRLYWIYRDVKHGNKIMSLTVFYDRGDTIKFIVKKKTKTLITITTF